jgi:hypothetical protein
MMLGIWPLAFDHDTCRLQKVRGQILFYPPDTFSGFVSGISLPDDFCVREISLSHNDPEVPQR